MHIKYMICFNFIAGYVTKCSQQNTTKLRCFHLEIKHSKMILSVGLIPIPNFTGVIVKSYFSKKVLPSTYFRGNMYSPVIISWVKSTHGITQEITQEICTPSGNKYSPARSEDFFLSTTIIYLCGDKLPR